MTSFSTILVFAAAVAPFAASASDMVAPNGRQTNPCLNVAAAKSSQWRAKRMMVRETQTFADGTNRQIEAIFTEDVAYAHIVGQPWMTKNLTRWERSVAAPDKVMKSMGLTGCELVGPATENLQPVSLYTFGYVPDANAIHVTGKIWISDATSLPIRQELDQKLEAAHEHVPVAITAQFSYGDSVKIPASAIRADESRRFLTEQHFVLGAPVGGTQLGTAYTAPGGHGHQ
ncbi:MAG: hypothetical protein ACREHF_10020 [Rhizomicrobium sp.]